MTSHFAEDTSVIAFHRVRETPTDLHAACGIGIGVLLGIAMWAVIVAASVAVIGWL